jgi:hypothetical protein
MYMTKHKIGLISLLLLALLLGASFQQGTCFTTDPLFTDTIGDNPSEPFCDIIDVWIDNTATHLRFKVNLLDPFNQTLSGYSLFAYVSVDNATGFPLIGFNIDYQIVLWCSGGGLDIGFSETGNGSNSLSNACGVGMAYFALSNNNHTVEWGYKLQSYSDSKGYLNITYGQLIYAKIEAGSDTDYAPNATAEPIGYTLETFGTGGIPGFPLLLSSALISVCALALRRKKSLPL